VKHIPRLAALAAAAALGATPVAAQLQRAEGPMRHDARPTTAAITAGDLRTHLYVIADDSMAGREAGKRGNVMATDYIAAQVARLGLRPAGENGTFFQEVPLREKGLSEGAAVSAGGTALALGDDFLPLPRYQGVLVFDETFEADGVEVVYGGRVGEPSAMISPEQARGKLVVFAAPLGPNGQPGFAFWQGGRSFARYADAAGVAIATLDYTAPGLRGFFAGTRTELAGAAADPAPAPAGMIVSVAAAERLLGAPMASLEVGAAGGRASGSYAYFDRPTAHPARNVLAVVPGTDPALRGQYVSIGSHNDHVGTAGAAVDHDSLLVFNRVFRPQGADQQPDPATPETQARFDAELARIRAVRPPRLDSIYNGADDDASGAMGLLEVARAFALRPERPRRSIVFVWHTGEELGLFGSSYFTDNPTVPRDRIVAQINLDMIGRGKVGDERGGGPDYLQLIGSRRLSTQLGDLVEKVNVDGRFNWTFDYQYDANGHPEQYYCRSDHFMYARYGIPVVFMSTGGHAEYHQVTDEVETLDFEKLSKVSRFTHALATAVANGPRPVVDKPAVGPRGQCVQ
jgi:hypothetical protein